jgi:hypothetical protein
LVDQVRFAPQPGKYKVYIIDEVHMLSSSAFNAFLKTLEEPPNDSLLLLLSALPEVLPDTIISRCIEIQLAPSDQSSPSEEETHLVDLLGTISPENFTGEKGKAGMSTDGPAKGAARDLGQGWKVSPFVRVPAKSTFTMADITGPGAIQQIWLTPAPLDKTRWNILRFYWDDETEPSIECPLGDFFACGWGRYCQINSMPVCVNPGSAFNCYWQMPFRKKAKITIENLDDNPMTIYYQINYTLTEVPEDAAYFHAQFRRENPLKTKGLYTILDGVEGVGLTEAPIRSHDVAGLGGVFEPLDHTFVFGGAPQIDHGVVVPVDVALPAAGRRGPAPGPRRLPGRSRMVG